jgi:hypothetical protein
VEKSVVDEVLDTASPPSEVVEGTPGVADRRRPGRVSYTNSTLIALLRSPAADPVDDKAARHTDDALAPARGAVYGVPIGALIWCVIALSTWFLLR